MIHGLQILPSGHLLGFDEKGMTVFHQGQRYIKGVTPLFPEAIIPTGDLEAVYEILRCNVICPPFKRGTDEIRDDLQRIVRELRDTIDLMQRGAGHTMLQEKFASILFRCESIEYHDLKPVEETERFSRDEGQTDA